MLLLEQVSDVNVWSPIFVLDGFVEDDPLLSFLKKVNEANVGDSSHDIVRGGLSCKGDFTV